MRYYIRRVRSRHGNIRLYPRTLSQSTFITIPAPMSIAQTIVTINHLQGSDQPMHLVLNISSPGAMTLTLNLVRNPEAITVATHAQQLETAVEAVMNPREAREEWSTTEPESDDEETGAQKLERQRAERKKAGAKRSTRRKGTSE
ncbi:hypothetical protein NMY22_g15552 [Coprinellus aureogranulatus]|nr:hypothetical protein NMY22_g15552 [Coprinellus aureogranulatus]